MLDEAAPVVSAMAADVLGLESTAGAQINEHCLDLSDSFWDRFLKVYIRQVKLHMKILMSWCSDPSKGFPDNG